MLHWFGTLAKVFLSFGYPGILAALIVEGLGLPFPGDAAMAFYGFEAAEGQFNLALTVTFSIAGYLIGSILAYAASRKYGANLGDRFFRFAMLSPRSMMRANRLFDHYGAWLLIPGRFLPGFRSVSSYIAGMGRMDFGLFVLYTVISAGIWCTGWVLVGYWLGENIEVVLHAIQSVLNYAAIAAVVLVTVWWMRRKSLR